MTDILKIDRRDTADWVTLNRPAKHNALDADLINALTDYFEGLVTNADVRVVVLRGAGKSFCSGLDLAAQMATKGEGTERIMDLMPAMRACPQPIVALLHGNVKGGGFVMALASDLRIAATSAKMDETFINIGLSGCDVGISYFLPRLIGLSLATELMMTGRAIDADRAERIGLVSEVVDDDALEAAGERIAQELCSKSALGLAKTKEILNSALAMDDLRATIALEVDTQLDVQRRDPAFKAMIKRFAK